MEKKQNELVAKLSDAKLAAVKQQASATDCVSHPPSRRTVNVANLQEGSCVTAFLFNLTNPGHAITESPTIYLRKPSTKMLGWRCTRGCWFVMQIEPGISTRKGTVYFPF